MQTELGALLYGQLAFPLASDYSGIMLQKATRHKIEKQAKTHQRTETPLSIMNFGTPPPKYRVFERDNRFGQNQF